MIATRDGLTAGRRFAGLELARPRIMGVVNVTPDSFSDGGTTATVAAAVKRGLHLVKEGADIIDVGGESTRPGAAPVPVDEELARVIPVVQELSGAGVRVSVDTRKSEVMAAAIDAGATIVNDVSALAADPRSLDVVANSTASVVLMHMRGDPRTMQRDPRYDNVVDDVFYWLAARISACQAAGIPRSRLAVDPGIGFGKTTEHNVALIAGLDVFTTLGCPVVIGVSRKSFIARLAGGDPPPDQRLGGSIAAVLAAVSRGADIVRVHDVGVTRQALQLWYAIDA